MNSKTIINYFSLILLTSISGLAVSYWNFSVLAIIGTFLFFLLILAYPDKALFFLIAYLPFQIALNPTQGIDLASGRVLILTIFCAWILKSFGEKKFYILNAPQNWLLLLFFLLSAVSILAADDTERAFRKIFVFLSIFPLYFLIISIVNSKEKLKNAVRLIFISAGIISFIGLIQFLAQFIIGYEKISEFWTNIIAPIFYGNTFAAQIIATPSWYVNISGKTFLRAFSLFPDPHMFSFYIGLVLPIAVALLFYKSIDNKSRGFVKNKILLIIVICLLLIVNCLSFSRGGYLGMIFGIFTVIFLLRKILITKKLIVSLAIVGIFGFLFLNNPVGARFVSIFDFEEGSNIGRIETWKTTAGIITDNPILGVGIGNYSYEIEPAANYRTPIYAHNAYLDIASEMGIFTLIVWILLVGITIWQMIKLAGNKNIEQNEIKLISAGIAGSLVWFSVHCSFETPIYSPTILAMLMVILGLGATVKRLAVYN